MRQWHTSTFCGRQRRRANSSSSELNFTIGVSIASQSWRHIWLLKKLINNYLLHAHFFAYPVLFTGLMSNTHHSKKKCGRRRIRTSPPNKNHHTGRTCKVERKRMFRYVDAEKQAQVMRRQGDTSHHAYKCPHCHHCHIGRNGKKAK